MFSLTFMKPVESDPSVKFPVTHLRVLTMEGKRKKRCNFCFDCRTLSWLIAFKCGVRLENSIPGSEVNRLRSEAVKSMSKRGDIAPNNDQEDVVENIAETVLFP